MGAEIFEVRRRAAWTDLPISPLGLGLSRIGSFTSAITGREACRLMEGAFAAGINVFDTADIYGQGESERLLGRTFRTRRSEVVFCTKIGYRLSAKARFAAGVKPVLKPVLRGLIRRRGAVGHALAAARQSELRQDFSARYLRSALEASLRRLKTDYIDLLLLHSPPTRESEDEMLQVALDAAVRDGKVRAFGVSCRSIEDVGQWLRLRGIRALQLRLGPAEQRAARSLLNEAKSRNVGIIAREVLASSGAVPDSGAAPNGQMPQPASAAAIESALAGALAAEGVDVVLIGTTRIDHLRQSVNALSRMAVAGGGGALRALPPITPPASAF